MNKGRGPLVIPDFTLYPELFEWSHCHLHYHFKNYMAYRLWSLGEWKEWQGLKRGSKLSSEELIAAHPELHPAVARKQAFCIYDYEPYQGGRVSSDYTGQVYADCEYPYSGISPSWADTYYASVEGQWIDITGLPSGQYILENEVNSNRMFEESSYRNNSAAVEVVIP